MHLGLGFVSDIVAGLRVAFLNVVLQRYAFHAPHAPSTNLNGWQFTAFHQGANLRKLYIQFLCHVF